MSVWGFYADSLSGWASHKTGSLSDDFVFPAANVYATSMLTGILATNDSFVFAGIVEYRKVDPNSGGHTTVPVGDLNISLDLGGVIIDQNVDRITFGMGVWDTGGGDFDTQVNSVNQVWLYE